MKEKKELLVIIPANNEEQNISDVIKQLKAQRIEEIADLLVIDDASLDETVQAVENEGCPLVQNIFWLGYGNSLRLGYKYAVRGGYRYVIQMDGDGQHDACNIPVIYQKLKQKSPGGECPDIVLASRFMEGSAEFPISLLRRAAYAWFRFVIYIVTGRRIADPTTGLKGLSRKAFSYYSEYQHFDDQYPDANMVIQMLLLKFQVVEIPAVMHMRTGGQSMHGGLKAFWYMCRMFFEIPAIVFRIKGLKKDEGAGLKDADMAWKENEISKG